jgi:hypothetical protein
MHKEPIVLRYYSEDFISLEEFKNILSNNFVSGQQEVSQESLSMTLDSHMEKITCLVENQKSEIYKIFKGVDYGRSSEGYQGPLVHLGFQKPISEFSIAHIRKLRKLVVEGNSEDALYFIKAGKLIFKDKEYLISANSFVFLENNGFYELTGKDIIISRFGKHDSLVNVDDQEKYQLAEEVQTCQWAFMNFLSGNTLEPHLHKMKSEFFYFSGDVDIDTDLVNPNSPKYSKRNGFISIKHSVGHSMQTNYGDVWFHSLNMPDILNDSKRL